MKLIVGLGNPGAGYSRNRHNIGLMCVCHFAREHGIVFAKKVGNARVGSGMVAGEAVIVARLQSYMNVSGEPVARLARRFSIRPEDLIIIHDDLDLAPGKIRLRQDGRSGGHKGISSIIAALGSRDFYRIKVGIGRPEDTGLNPRDKEAAVVGYVLSDFTPEEAGIMAGVIPAVSAAIVCLLTEGVSAAMNKYNRSFIGPEKQV